MRENYKLAKKDFLSSLDMSSEDIIQILDLGLGFKKRKKISN